MDRLDYLTNWSFDIFDKLNNTFDYQLAFSGGKDSHVLLGIYLAWCKNTGKTLSKTKVVFSDTFLEAPQLYILINKAEKVVKQSGISFYKVQPRIEKNFWVTMFGLGYPVPNHQNRWCTKNLKTDPMSKIGGIVLAGSHEGESKKRDKRLQTCGSSECGIDKITNKIEPLAIWQNCDIWDWLILRGDEYLYQGASDNLLKLYDIQESQKGSLRMGCFMCPVVSKDRIQKQVDDGTIPSFSIKVRELIEKLRIAPRLLSPKSKNSKNVILGATLVDVRIQVWKELQEYIPEMMSYGWIDQETIDLVNSLHAKRSYPPRYTEAWILEHEPNATRWSYS